MCQLLHSVSARRNITHISYFFIFYINYLKTPQATMNKFYQAQEIANISQKTIRLGRSVKFCFFLGTIIFQRELTSPNPPISDYFLF